ncbi:MAG TPA: DegT/DnrJ/EryC1/StrS aminotransferase family protein [Usitatibacter sp.]|jgi:dTDP-4-amino-4,6-dideoxygalactose transaminase|nr:DegT/DnrJ/EryC1/StrS aminotransferase family protein [Usitatibacter sp.]
MTTPDIRPDYLPFGRPHFSEAEIEAVTKVLRSGWIGMGAETVAFEQELASAVGAPHVVTVDTCTSAIFLSLVAEGVAAGDEVITPSLTWCATANASIYLGAKPVFCDVDPETFCVTAESIARRVTERTRAVVIVHYGGYAIDVRALRAALPARVKIIEDAAHAFGSRYADGTPVGSSGNLTCFSFYANKNLSTGEGGAVALFDGEKAARIASLRQNAQAADAWKRFTHANTVLLPGIRELGYKMNYTDLQAAIGRHQLARQPEFAVRRRAIAQRYAQALRSLPEIERVQAGATDERHARHLFVVSWNLTKLGRSRNDLLLELRGRNVGASVHYLPLHLMPYYRDIDPVELQVTEHLASRIMTLPIGSAMSEADADYVVTHLRDLLATKQEKAHEH